MNVSSERDGDATFSELAETHAGGLIIGADAYTVLVSYRTNVAGGYQAGIYAGRILKGEKPPIWP